MKQILKTIYKVLPFKKHIFNLIKVIHTPPQRIYKHLHFIGQFEIKVSENKKFKMHHFGFMIENEVFWKGISCGWEKHSMRIWKRLCENSNVIFDIGANTGIYSLVAKAIQPNSKVYAFEPVERVFDKLEMNVNLNQFDVFCEKKAVSNQNGKAIIYDTNSEHTLSVAVNKNISLNPEDTFEVEIDTITLDRFIDQNKIEKIDLMKIDVETHEVEALEGFRKYIQKFEPSMLIEILNDEVARGIENIISEIEYCYFNIDENSGIREVPYLEKSDYYNYLICKQGVADEVRTLYGLEQL